jgi:hypothetical protein
MRSRLAFAATGALALVCACQEPEFRGDSPIALEPAGVIRGAVLYNGPPPCTLNGHVVGAAIVLLLDLRLLPPPDGLGTSAGNVAVVPGDVLFSGVAATLPQSSEPGKMYCPDPASSPTITVTAPFAISPVPAAKYQVRSFYDRDGDFSPLFKVLNLPTAGDVGGGALANAAAVLAGVSPVYQTIQVGDAKGQMPATGAVVDNVSVSLGIPIPTQRPYFYHKAIFRDGAVVPYVASDPKSDPKRIEMPSDYWLPVFSTGDVSATEKSLLGLVVGAGVPPEEASDAARAPLQMRLGQGLFEILVDSNKDGHLGLGEKNPNPKYAHPIDHIPDSELVPSIDPQIIFAKLDDRDANLQTAQASPVVIIQSITTWGKVDPADNKVKIGSMVNTVLGSMSPAKFAEQGQFADEILAYVRPSAICINPLAAEPEALLITPHEADKNGNPIITDPTAVLASLKTALGVKKSRLKVACLPQGKYGLNLIYSATGQAWSIPNEAGACGPTETPQVVGGKSMCSSRPKLASQFAYLTVTPPTDPSACTGDKATPPECLPPKK